MNGLPPSSTTSYTVTAFGWAMRAAARASRSVRSRITRRCSSVELRRRHDLLDGDVAVEHLVVGRPDRAHAAAAEHPLEAVAPGEESALRGQRLCHRTVPYPVIGPRERSSGVRPPRAVRLRRHALARAARHPPPQEAPMTDTSAAGPAGRGGPRGVRVHRAGARARGPPVDGAAAARRPGPGAARHAQPARAGGRRDGHRQDEDPAAHGRAAVGAGRAGVPRRHQGRPVGRLPGGPAERQADGAHAEHRPELAGHGLPGRVPGARRPRHRRPGARDGDQLRPRAAGEGARPQRDPVVEPAAGLPLRGQDRARPARPQGPARRHPVPGVRRGAGRPRLARRPVEGHGRGDPARARGLRRQRGRAVLRRARVRHQGPACASRRTAAAW